MRRFGPLLLLLAALPLTAIAQDPPEDKGGDGSGPEVAASSELEVVLGLYKIAHGGKERFDGLRTMAFDYTPSVYDEEGNELMGVKRRVSILFRPDLDEQEQRTVRIEKDVVIEGEDPAKTVAIVTGSGAKVWVEGADGELIRSEAQRFQNTASFHASALLNQLDLVYWLDGRDVRCRFGGVLKRDGKDYATIEAEFAPGRQVPEPTRLYISGTSSLIERVDVFDPKFHMRTSTAYLEEYADHGGIKFPGRVRQVDRRGRPVGNWYLEGVELNGEFEPEFWAKP